MKHPFNYRAMLLGAAVVCGAMSQTPLWAQESHPFAAQAPASEVKTLAVVAVNSYDELVSDIGFAGSLADRPETAQMIDGMIALFTQGKGLSGLDKSKPWGVVVQTDGVQFLPIGCVPASNADQLISVAEGLGARVQELSQGVKELSLPGEKTVYVQSQGGWAFVGLSDESLTYAPRDPSALLSQLVSEYDFAARVWVQNAPEMYRQQAIAALQAGMKQGLEQKQPGEDEEQYQARRKLAELQMQQLVQMFEDLDDVTFGWAFDSEQQRTYADFIYRFLPDTKMAKQLSSYGQPRTNFAGFYQSDAAMTMTFANKTDPALIQADLDQFKAAMQTVRQQALRTLEEEDEIPDEATREAVKAALNDFMDAFEATIEAGEMDGGSSLQLEPNKFTFVAGALVKEPGKIENGLKKIVEVAKNDPEFPGIEWNVASHAGVQFHTMQVPVPENEDEARKMFGENLDVAIGIGSEAVYFAAGQDALEELQQAIDASQAEPNKAVPPFELSFSLGPIMATAATYEEDPDEKQVMQTIADMLQGEAQGRDHIRMVGQFIPNGQRYRFEAEEGVLRAIGKAAAAAQQQMEP